MHWAEGEGFPVGAGRRSACARCGKRESCCRRTGGARRHCTAIGGVAFADDASVKEDLTTVIALHGLPCGQVTDVRTLGDNGHIASCQDGNRYHIFINAQGRVVAEKQ